MRMSNLTNSLNIENQRKNGERKNFIMTLNEVSLRTGLKPITLYKNYAYC